jgi:hypothetical protein
MSSTTRAKKKRKKRAKNKSRHESKSAKSEGQQSTMGVEHAGQEHADEFLKQITQHAPWDAWAAKLAERRQPLPLPKLMPHARECPLIWSTSRDTPAATLELLNSLYRLRRRRHRNESPADWSLVAEEWIESRASSAATVDSALEALAWTHGLSRLAVRLPASLWSSLVKRLVDLAAHWLEPTPLEDVPVEPLLLSQLLGGELPLTLAYVFPKVECCQEMTGLARARISEGLLASLDGEGIPHARLATDWRRLLAGWTRGFFLDKLVPGKSISSNARLQFEWLVRQSLRFCRPAGTLLLSDDTVPVDAKQGLLASAVDAGGDRADRELLAIARGRLRLSDSTFDFHVAGEHSEWAELSLLRTDWSHNASCLALAYANGAMRSELRVGKRRIWQGSLLPAVRVDERTLTVDGEWEELCWSSDDDVDYLELEIDLSDGWRLQRQLLLAREDGFLFSADVLLGPQRGRIDYRLELPLDAALDIQRDEQTSEVWLSYDKPLARVYPLSLSEWRIDSRLGRFNGRVLEQTVEASRLYAPLFVDLNRTRHGKLHTWRQLTVGEDLRLVPRDVAVGYRIQIGSRQWVVYRALETCGNRTFLGHNLTSEFLVARFDTDGELDNLIEIE